MLRGLAGVIVLALAVPAPAGTAPDDAVLGIEATTSFWVTLHEQVENGLVQAGSGDPAADEASGFNFKQGRLALRFREADGRLSGLLRLRLEERTDLLDFWGGYRVAPLLTVKLGQMKIPATHEVLTPDHRTDFALRSTFGEHLGDYALARTPYISSIMAARSYDRDLGLALEGELAGATAGRPRAAYFLMIANGLGGNRYIGGGSSDEFLHTNAPGDLYYGLRVEGSPVAWGTLGLHGSINRHQDVALDERGPVFDLDRRVWTADVRLAAPGRGRAGGFYGDGRMEDYWSSAAYRFDFTGWGIWGFWELSPDRLELGCRHDVMTTEFQQDGYPTEQRDWTLGVNWMPRAGVRLQLNYVARRTDAARRPDLDDDVLCLNVQFAFARERALP